MSSDRLSLLLLNTPDNPELSIGMTLAMTLGDQE